MNFTECFGTYEKVMMEGALGERLKREYHLEFDEFVAMAALIYSREGADALTNLWKEYREIARRYRLPFLATTPTRRANRDRVAASGFTESILADNVKFLRRVRQEGDGGMYIGGLMGCRGDAYTGEGAMPESEARDFHAWQADRLSRAGVDFLYAGIMPCLPEAAGMAQAMAQTNTPYIISFTIQKNGRLIDGTSITDAIKYIDSSTLRLPVCYMTNCVHPAIALEALSQPFQDPEIIRERFRGIQANTSPLSYEELDGSDVLHCSLPEEFAQSMAELGTAWDMKVFGGCCGTDNRHMEQLAMRLQTG